MRLVTKTVSPGHTVRGWVTGRPSGNDHSCAGLRVFADLERFALAAANGAPAARHSGMGGYRYFLSAISNRVLEIGPSGVHTYGGGYTEFVSETGREAPGVG